MCDYSLHLNKTRLAQEGEQLVVHRFPGGSIGLASPAECEPDRSTGNPQPNRLKFWSWSAIANWLAELQQEPPAPTAVCIPPCARLVLCDIPLGLQKQFAVSEAELVVFDQLNANVNTYRDCVRFKSGQSVLLQRLRPGQRVEVLSLAGRDEPVAQPSYSVSSAA
jgi:hypothetical protein